MTTVRAFMRRSPNDVGVDWEQGIVIRKMLPGDIQQVGEVWLAASIQAHDFVAEEFWRADLQTMTTEILPHPRTEAYVFESAGRIDGFVSLGGSHVGCLFVRPDRQNQGIGAALLGQLADATSIRLVFIICSFLPLIGLLAALLPNVRPRDTTTVVAAPAPSDASAERAGA